MTDNNNDINNNDDYDDNMSYEEIAADFYRFLSGVDQTVFDDEGMKKILADNDDKTTFQMSFVMKDGKHLRTQMTIAEFHSLFDFITSHKELGKRIKIVPMRMLNKDLR